MSRLPFLPYPPQHPSYYKTAMESKPEYNQNKPSWPFDVGDHCTELLNRDKHYWTEDETGLMLELYEENREYFSDARTKKTKLWSVIANMINKKFSTNVNSEQCSQKYRNMKAEYLKISDSDLQEGEKKFGRHYHQMKRLIDSEERYVHLYENWLTKEKNDDDNTSPCSSSSSCKLSPSNNNNNPPNNHSTKLPNDDVKNISSDVENDGVYEEAQRQKGVEINTDVEMSTHSEESSDLNIVDEDIPASNTESIFTTDKTEKNSDKNEHESDKIESTFQQNKNESDINDEKKILGSNEVESDNCGAKPNESGESESDTNAKNEITVDNSKNETNLGEIQKIDSNNENERKIDKNTNSPLQLNFQVDAPEVVTTFHEELNSIFSYYRTSQKEFWEKYEQKEKENIQCMKRCVDLLYKVCRLKLSQKI